MPHTIQIGETHYRWLVEAAHTEGLSVNDFVMRMIEKQRFVDESVPAKDINPEFHKKSRWAELSERIRKKPPLSGAGDYVWKCAKEFREDFAFHHDVEQGL